jgi:hypothetical protein
VAAEFLGSQPVGGDLPRVMAAINLDRELCGGTG